MSAEEIELVEKVLMWMIFALMVYQIIVFFARLAANYFLLKKVGKNKWLGLIPVVNTFMLFNTFWNRTQFWVYTICYCISFAIDAYGSDATIIDDAVNMVVCIIMLCVMVGLYNRIREAFGKGWLWTAGMILCYPLFALILALRGNLDPAFVAELERKAKEKETETGT